MIRSLTRSALPLTAMAMMAGVPAQATQVQIQATGPVIELSVTEQVESEPDMVTMSAGVTTRAPTAVEALRQNSRDMRAVIERLEALGIAERDIQTSGISLNADFDFDREQRRQIFRGYEVSNRVSVKLDDIDDVGAILDSLVEAGATDLSGPDFGLDDDTDERAAARARAVERAQAQAQEYAALAGYDSVRLLSIGENIRESSRPMPRQRGEAIMVTGSAVDQSAPVRPGLIGTSVTINVQYEMTR